MQNEITQSEMNCARVTIHIPPHKEGCGLRPLVPPLEESEQLRETSARCVKQLKNCRIHTCQKHEPTNERQEVHAANSFYQEGLHR